MRQKSPNPASVRKKSGSWNNLLSKTSAAKRKVFFVHWRGRMVLSKARSMVLFYLRFGILIVNPGMNQDVKSILDRIRGWSLASKNQVGRLAGLKNVKYRIAVNGERFMLPVKGKNKLQLLCIDIKYKMAALQMAPAASTGPEVIAFVLP